MDLGDAFKSPIVWGGGALVGVVLLLRSSGAEAAPPANYNPSVVGNTTAVNSAVYGAQVELAKVNAGLGEAAYKADLGKQLGFYQLLATLDNNNRVVSSQRISANAGVANSLIQSSTAIIVDQSNNAARLSLAYQTTAQTKINADKDVKVARYQYKGQKAAAKASLWSNVAGAVSNVAGKAITAGFGGF